VIYGEERGVVERNSRTVEKLINNLGFVARIEDVNTMDAWLGSLPGHSVENIRRPMINTLNLADLLPVSSVWTGSAMAPCPFYPEGSPPLAHVVTTGDTAFNLNLHVSDIGSAFLVGPTGSGKSTLLAFLVAQLRRYRGMTAFCFDRGMSMYTYCSAAGGTHYSVGDDMAFCPLQYLVMPQDRAWAAEWISQICALNGLETTAQQRNQITGAIQNMYACNHTTLTDFCCSVRDLRIQDVLREYTVAGSHPTLFDAPEDTLNLDVLTVFEVEELMGMDPRFGLPTLLYIFRRLERSIHNRAMRGEPSCIMLDEAWLMLGHPVFREKIKDWLRTMRKANCVVVMATQSLSDAINSGILDIVKDSTATKIFLPNPSARDVDGGALYQRFGLNEQEIGTIASATPKREYMIRTDEHCRLVDLVLGPLSLAFVGVSDKESVAQVKKLQQQFGNEWVNEWLRRRGVNQRIVNNEQAICA
jgi:type IV secretion/conjugal transfer VirB4 family ATPase